MLENELSIEEVELCALLEAIYLRWGYDFRSYSKASLKRRVFHMLKEEGIEKISELQHEIIRDKGVFLKFVQNVTVNVTEMFRDPSFYAMVREMIVPRLKTYPHIKIWHAGCATGEEAYSMSILLNEEGIADRTTIYATDINKTVLERARAAIYSDNVLPQYEANYKRAGGKGDFSDYYTKGYDHFILDSKLKSSLVFTEHDLVIDHVFGEMQLVMCRNVLIYFTRELQNKVLNLFRDSLDYGGFLCLGTKESIASYPHQNAFQTLDPQNRIYQMVSKL